MENRFDLDALAKTLASGLPRREALRRLGGGLAGALLASLGLGKAWGQNSNAAPSAFCVDYCRDCGISPADGVAFGNCVSSCETCLTTDGTLCTCPPSLSGEVLCCASGEFCDEESLICS
jgi:hypothetical protein